VVLPAEDGHRRHRPQGGLRSRRRLARYRTGCTATHTGPLVSPNGDIPPTGKPVTLDFVDVTQFAEGRIAREHIYFDQMAFLSQLGLPATCADSSEERRRSAGAFP
jgi:ketosteroid isomerase-like protein